MRITRKIRVLAVLVVLIGGTVAEAGTRGALRRDSGSWWGELVRWVERGISSAWEKSGVGMDPNGSPAPGTNTAPPQNGGTGDSGVGMDPNG